MSTAGTNATTQQETRKPPETLSWSQYFRERGKRRRRNLVYSYMASPAAFGYTFYETANAITYNVDDKIWGVPAMGVYLGCTLAASLFAAALAPSVLESMWRIVHSRRVKQIDYRDREFYKRVNKYRADASLSPIGTPGGSSTMYDYYGEKITSIADYRVWIRKQSKIKKDSGVDVAMASTLGPAAFDPAKVLKSKELD